MDRNGEQKIRSLAGQIAGEFGFELFDVALHGKGRRVLLRVMIDKDSGVTLNDCETFSRRFEALLDVEDVVGGPYTLEVSSPGLDRPLKDLGDFRKYIGKLVRIVTKEQIDNQSFFLGRIEGVHDDTIRISLFEGKKEIVIPYGSISRARLEIELK